MFRLATPSIHVGTPYPWHTIGKFLEDKVNEPAVTKCLQVINHPRWHNDELTLYVLKIPQRRRPGHGGYARF